MEKNRSEESVMELDIELFTLVQDIAKNIVYIILGGLAVAMLSYVIVSARYVPQYTTSTTFVVGSKGSNNSYSNLSSAYTMATTFQKLLESTVMKEIICDEMKVEEIDATITAEVLEGTNLLVLTVTDDTAKDAIDIIRIIMENYSDLSLYTVGNGILSVLEEPKIPYAVSNPLNAMSVAKKAFLAGAALCILIFGFLSYMVIQTFGLLVIFIMSLFNKDLMNLFITNEIINIEMIKLVIYTSIFIYSISFIVQYFVNLKLFEKGVNVD